MEKVYTKEEILAMKRGPSLYPPIIVNFLSGRSMIFHDVGGTTVRIAEDVTPEDSSAIWVRLPHPDSNAQVSDNVEYQISGSKGTSYTVTLHSGQWSCDCQGFGFRRQCRHINEAKNKQADR
jgi:hypothetical protein